MSYQGWTNYATWAVALWIDNDEALYMERLSRVQEAYDDRGERDAKHAVADDLKDWIEDMAPDLGASLWGDLLTSALGSVDWEELSEHWLEDVRTEEPA